MSYSFQSGVIRRAKLGLDCALLAVGVVLSGQLCEAADPVIPPIPQATDWLSGPASNSLSPIASIRIPQSYKFADETGARAFLERVTNSVPKGLVGILCPESEGWWIVFTLAETGYVNEDQKGTLDADAILQSLRARLQQKNRDQVKQGSPPPTTTVDWELKPLYDPNDHTLEWAVRVQGQQQTVVNHTVRLFGRHGALEASVVRPYKGFSDLVPLKQLVQGISFNPGERYADYQKGDKLCAAGLAGMIAVDKSAWEVTPAGSPLASTANAWVEDPKFLIGVALFGCVAAVGGVMLLVRRYRRLTISREKEEIPTQAVGSASGPLEENSSSPVVLEVPGKVSAPGSRPSLVAHRAAAKASPPASQAKVEAPKRVNGKQQVGHRKKVFDYNRYFSDLNSAVSGHLGQMESGGVNGYESESERSARTPAAYESISGGQAGINENLDFIASQKALIEEQKRLIHEQSKLIEEKTRLIAEKNQLLKLQSEMIDDKLL